MRLIVVLAGSFGFLTVLAGSFLWEKSLEESIVNGIVCALIAAILIRWWMRLWIRCLEKASRHDEILIQQESFEAELNEPQSESRSSESRRP